MASKLEIQLEKLKRKMDKVSYYKDIKMAIYKEAEKYNTPICTEVKEELNRFIDKMINLIENEEESSKQQTVTISTQTSTEVNLPTEVVQEKPPNKQDKMAFALEHRNLGGKTVILSTPNGEVEGTVNGLDCPNVIVATVTGYVVTVHIDKIRLKEEK